MLIEQSAYSNRWRYVSATAKGCFSACGMIAAFAAGSPLVAISVVLIMVTVTLFGAGVPPLRYLRIASPALLFLATSTLSLAVSLNFGSSLTEISLSPSITELPHIARIACRSLACLASLLFLALTTPLPDIVTLLRRCKVPGTILDLMILCYRTLFVLSESVHCTFTAQSARLGYVTLPLSIRSMGKLFANLTTQVWQRSQVLHQAALARNNDGELRFIAVEYPNSGRNITIAVTTGALMIALAVTIP